MFGTGKKITIFVTGKLHGFYVFIIELAMGHGMALIFSSSRWIPGLIIDFT
jgi:hypothetical protein